MIHQTGVGSGEVGRIEQLTLLVQIRESDSQSQPEEGHRQVEWNEVGVIPDRQEGEKDRTKSEVGEGGLW